MNRRSWRRHFSRRKVESFVAAVAAIGAGVGVARQGTLVDHTVSAPVARLVEQAVPQTALTRVATANAAERSVVWDIPNVDHQHVDRWISRFTGDLKRSFQIYLARMDRYDEMIAQKAAEHGVPQDLVYLAMIESGGDAKARSPVGARGLWQLMAPTAREYGLSSAERTNPEKSTVAALKYLSDLHDRFGSWYLAAAAYNTGQGRVARVLRQVTGRSRGTDADFFRIASRLPKETRDYVPKLIAAARIAKEPEKYGIDRAG